MMRNIVNVSILMITAAFLNIGLAWERFRAC